MERAALPAERCSEGGDYPAKATSMQSLEGAAGASVLCPLHFESQRTRNCGAGARANSKLCTKSRQEGWEDYITMMLGYSGMNNDRLVRVPRLA